MSVRRGNGCSDPPSPKTRAAHPPGGCGSSEPKACPLCRPTRRMGLADVTPNNVFDVDVLDVNRRCSRPRPKVEGVVSVGPMGPEHLMLCFETEDGKDHVARLSHLDAEAIAEMEDRIAFIEKRVGPRLWHESGVLGKGRRDGCSIEHNHLHMYPADFDAYAVLLQRFGPHRVKEISGLLELTHRFPKNAEHPRNYLYIRTPHKRHYVVDVGAMGEPSSIPSEFLRKALVLEKGHGDPTYRNNRHPGMALGMVQRFGPLFAEPPLTGPEMAAARSWFRAGSTSQFYDSAEGAKIVSERTRGLDLQHVYRPFFDLLPSRPWILEIGCGAGASLKAFYDLLAEAGKKPGRITAVDLSQRMIALARITAPQAEFIRMPLELLHERKDLLGAFDLVNVAGTLMHFDAEGKVAHWHQAQAFAKPGGLVYMGLRDAFQYGRQARGPYMDDHGRAYFPVVGNHASGQQQILDLHRAALHQAALTSLRVGHVGANIVQTWTTQDASSQKRGPNRLEPMVDHQQCTWHHVLTRRAAA